MPHNLYLHSSLVQTRKFDRSSSGIRKAIRYNVFDSAIALNLAFFVNASILILAASTFFRHGFHEIAELQDAHRLLEPLLGSELAPILFGIALVAAGQSSTITGTLAGQIVMEGYLNLRIQPWLRRLLTRILAIIPALITIIVFGEGATGELLVLSQVILSLQLGFAIIPLIHFVSDKGKMGEFVIPVWMKVAAWICAMIIVGLNMKLIIETLGDWIGESEDATLIWCLAVPVALLAFALLIYITLRPLFRSGTTGRDHVMHRSKQALETFEAKTYHRIVVAVDFTRHDQESLNTAISQGGKGALYLLVHVLESPVAMAMGHEAEDAETQEDIRHLREYTENLKNQGYACEYRLGHGNPKKVIPHFVSDFRADLLVLGAHGHRGLKDIIFGTVVEAVRHRVKVPVLIVK
jgi:manganese transport protein